MTTALGTHVSVLRADVVEALAPRSGAVIVDGTFGRGGHTRALLEVAGTRVIAFDRDPAAIEAGQAMVQAFAPRLTLLEGRFGEMESALVRVGIALVDGVTFDFGVSSPQLDEPERGFSFQADGPLDMRMERQGPTAADIVNTASEEDLATWIRTYGGERYARRVAGRIVEARAVAPFTRTGALADVVRRAVPRSGDGLDPATRTFQALRIVVNDELGEIERGLLAAETILKPAGRLAVIAFHELEDGAVKRFLVARSEGRGGGASRHAPPKAAAAHAPTFRLVTRKPLRPSAAEVAANPRARSARLRVAERTHSIVEGRDPGEGAFVRHGGKTS